MKEVECPERDHCISLSGEPIGMYHCGYCGMMILAGTDPVIVCPCLNPENWIGTPEEYNEMIYDIFG